MDHLLSTVAQIYLITVAALRDVVVA